MRYAPLALVVGLTGVFAFSLLYSDPQNLPSARAGKEVLPFSIPALYDGPPVGADDLKTGSPLLLNVWASWCGPCRDEHPVLMALRAQGIPIIGLNYKDGEGTAQRFLNQLGNPYQKIGVDADGRVAIDLGVYGVPETFIVDGAGRVVDRHVGPLDMDIWRQELAPYFEASLSGDTQSKIVQYKD